MHIELLKHMKSQQNYTYENKVTGHKTVPHVSSMAGTLLIFAKQKNIMHFLLLEQL